VAGQRLRRAGLQAAAIESKACGEQLDPAFRFIGQVAGRKARTYLFAIVGRQHGITARALAFRENERKDCPCVSAVSVACRDYGGHPLLFRII
jgi:hypothetical protein